MSLQGAGSGEGSGEGSGQGLSRDGQTDRRRPLGSRMEMADRGRVGRSVERQPVDYYRGEFLARRPPRVSKRGEVGVAARTRGGRANRGEGWIR